MHLSYPSQISCIFTPTLDGTMYGTTCGTMAMVQYGQRRLSRVDLQYLVRYCSMVSQHGVAARGCSMVLQYGGAWCCSMVLQHGVVNSASVVSRQLSLESGGGCPARPDQQATSKRTTQTATDNEQTNNNETTQRRPKAQDGGHLRLWAIFSTRNRQWAPTLGFTMQYAVLDGVNIAHI